MTTKILRLLVIAAALMTLGLAACVTDSGGVLPAATPVRPAVETVGNEEVILVGGQWLVQDVAECTIEVPEDLITYLDSFDGPILNVLVPEAAVYVRCPEVHTEPVIRFVPRP